MKVIHRKYSEDYSFSTLNLTHNNSPLENHIVIAAWLVCYAWREEKRLCESDETFVVGEALCFACYMAFI